MIFFVQATADIESRALLALIVISLQLGLESCSNDINGRSHFITFHYCSLPFPRVCFNMFYAVHHHSTTADSCDSCRYPVLWMSLAQLVGSATSICVVLISLLLASISYALLRFDQMHRATLELSLASEAICSQAPHANRNVTNM